MSDDSLDTINLSSSELLSLMQGKLPKSPDEWRALCKMEKREVTFGYEVIVPLIHQNIKDIEQKAGSNAEAFKEEVLKMVEAQRKLLKFAETYSPPEV
jgi:hypothetical protein